MAIEFRCQQCGRLLRTPDDTAGRQAQCPECHTLTNIPGGNIGSGGASPFAAATGPTGEEINPYQSPGVFAEPSGGHGPHHPIQPQQIDFEDVFSRTWEIFKRQWGPCLVAVLIVMGISFGFSVVVNILAAVIAAATQEHSMYTLVSNIGSLFGWLLGIWLGIGQALFFLKVARGRAVDFSEIFSGGSKFFSILLATLLVAVICLGGWCLCIVPGVIFGLMFSQFYYLILDRDLGITESLEVSKQVMVGNKLTLFLVWLAMAFGGFFFILFTCLLGFLVVVPFGNLLAAVVYLCVTGQPTDNGQEGALR